jgi:FKBP-type peptidyl-prolyl cis-trans isomerase
MARPLISLLILGGLVFGTAGCGQSRPTPVAPSAYRPIGTSGLKYAIIRPGTGREAQPIVRVTVHFTGWVQGTGRKFDSTLDTGQPFDFVLGYDDTIEGWDLGIRGMRVGEKRQLIVPPALGYGPMEAPAGIPPNATLVFEVELLKVG